MMRHPGEVRRVEVQMNSCPNCGERYCGDGVESCTECATPKDEAHRGGEETKEEVDYE